MPGCPIQITVRYADGKPAAFASVTAFEVSRVLWWEVDKYAAATVANFEGIVKFDLTKGRKYHFVFRAGTKKGDVWKELTYCNVQMSASFPY